MKTRILAGVLLMAVVIGGCSGEKTYAAEQVRRGVYMGTSPADFPFPKSGYTVYIVGETHGNRETKLVLQSFLNNLYHETGLRDVILEEDQAYETEANQYVHGLTATLPSGLCLRADVLGQIREFNTALPDDERVSVHLVDVDSPLLIIHKHLQELHTQIGPSADSIQIPYSSELKNWSLQQRNDLIDELKEAARAQPEILNELDTISLSLRWYDLGNRMDIGWPTGPREKFAPIREDVITKNIRNVLSQVSGRPVLAFFGLAHGMKSQGISDPPTPEFKTWAQRLVEENASVYSVAILGASGTSDWRGQTLPDDGDILEQFEFTDGFPVVSLFDAHPDSEIIYMDYRVDENSTLTLSPIFLDVPARQIFDGLIVYRQFTPMENACDK
jgi:hypothetical protein